jgi:hypothetical protein
MFRDLVATLGGGVLNANDVLTQYTPAQHAEYLEAVWSGPRNALRDFNFSALQSASVPAPPAPSPNALSRAMAREFADLPAPLPVTNPANRLFPNWGHLIGAYMVENTGIVEIMRRLLTDWTADERLPFATLETQYWMRTTEELFFTSPNPFFNTLASSIRPDSAAIRENAYQRLLGMGLSFRRSTGTSLPSPRIANSGLVPTLERLLYEVWRGYINRLNANNENLTDRQAVADLVADLREMLLARRTNGTLMREEFMAVATLSWFHLTVEHNTLVVENLNAQAESSGDRLRKIAALVGMQPSRATDAYFRLADPLSALLILIEDTALEVVGVEKLYDGVFPNFTNMIQSIVSNWEKATGRPIKDANAVRTLQMPVITSIAPPASVLNRLAGAPVTTT